ncbi:MnhB domain-containing protein [Kutzneria kofuensis]|uniref:Multicomponent Na+:H+ antiporter subunit B n=1 Tax=Kutzneria kofuensis TaxID=103725 RepID=A0A7W9KR16_9PSEU|nr:MnhB domain-containing protein [Kutzneria kofuensis]MBB5897165.1 multicomponent Na+:H+ antiporter subunit B [Kutzneria kofuensis]
MSRSARWIVFWLGAGGVGTLIVLAVLKLPFGGLVHPYRELSVPAAIGRSSPNIVSSVNFDQRALDTLGEETILLGSVVGAAALLRPSKNEREQLDRDEGRVLEATKLLGYLLLPVTLIVGADVVTHGHLTPGGGFQGGVVLATGVHLLYVAGSYRMLRRLRPTKWYQLAEAVAAGAFVVLGLVGLLLTGAFLANVLPLGVLGDLFSSGTVFFLNVAVGAAVTSGVVVLLAGFLAQALSVREVR